MSGGRLLYYVSAEGIAEAMGKADDLRLTYSVNKTFIPGEEVIINQAEIDAWERLPKKQRDMTAAPTPIKRRGLTPLWTMLVTAPTIEEAQRGAIHGHQADASPAGHPAPAPEDDRLGD